MKKIMEVEDIELSEFLQLLRKGDSVSVFTDGSCSGNPGPGGWGVVYESKAKRATLSGFSKATTNNQMEMMAAIKAIEQLPADVDITIYTDSMYVKNGITQWIKQWKVNGWRSASNKPVKNQDLWVQLDAIQSEKNIKWEWVKGHALCANNEMADFLARSAVVSSIMDN